MTQILISLSYSKTLSRDVERIREENSCQDHMHKDLVNTVSELKTYVQDCIHREVVDISMLETSLAKFGQYIEFPKTQISEGTHESLQGMYVCNLASRRG